MNEKNIAYLSNNKDLISFKYNNYNIRFRGPYSLEYFTEIKKWDNGYIVVMTKYKHSKKPIEEYIDLIPILTDLYIEPEKFLKNIKEVIINYGD